MDAAASTGEVVPHEAPARRRLVTPARSYRDRRVFGLVAWEALPTVVELAVANGRDLSVRRQLRRGDLRTTPPATSACGVRSDPTRWGESVRSPGILWMDNGRRKASHSLVFI